MLDSAKYINHLGAAVEFGEAPLFISENDLRDYEWKYDSNNNNLSNFNKKAVYTKKLPVIIVDGADLNAIYETFDKDVIDDKYGKLYIGAYYINCKMYKSTKEEYTKQGYKKFTLEFITDNPNWIKASVYHGFKEERTETTSSNERVTRNYPRIYPYQYSYDSGTSRSILFKTSTLSKSGFELVIFGPVTDPSLYINNHLYGVNCTVGTGEYLTINSMTKTITLTKVSGTEYNYFQNRNKTSNIFEQISGGSNVITWSGGFGFDISVFEERGEPIWT